MCFPVPIQFRGLSSHSVGVENSPLKQIYSPWRRTINSFPPPSGKVPVLATS